MIDVPELDIYLKAVYYAFNSNTEIYRGILSDKLKSQISFVYYNSGLFARFQNLVQQPEFGFSFTIGQANSMYGSREIRNMCDPYLLLPAPFLKIYPRLLYSYNFIKQTENLGKHEYYFRYYPKMIVRIYEETNGVTKLRPSAHWIIGTHTETDNKRHLISYNVAVDVDLSTIIEEELHAQIENLHQTTNTNELTKKVQNEMPDLKQEIEANLNRILTTEEKRFLDLGDMLRVNCASELRLLKNFVNDFENEIIQSTELNLPPDPSCAPNPTP
jgi:hypothetical protein